MYEDKICSEHVPHSSESTLNSKCVLSQVTPYLRLQKAMLRNNTKVNTEGNNSIDVSSNKADRKIKPNSKLIVFFSEVANLILGGWLVPARYGPLPREHEC